jgi:hypothetical protein
VELCWAIGTGIAVIDYMIREAFSLIFQEWMYKSILKWKDKTKKMRVAFERLFFWQRREQPCL